jgi:hypothetical protein
MIEFEPLRHWKWAGSFLGSQILYDHVFSEDKPNQTTIRFTVDAGGGPAVFIRGIFGWIYRKGAGSLPTGPRATPQPKTLFLSLLLEVDEGAEGDAEIVVRSAGKIHFVADVQAKADRAEMAFKAAAGIECGAHILRTQILDRAGKGRESGRPGIEAEVSETALQRNEGPNRTVASNDFWPKQAMQDAEIATLESNCACAGIRETLSEGLREIVAHLPFHHDVRKSLERCAAAETRFVGLRLRDAEIIDVSADLKLILGLRQRNHATC